MGKRFRWWLHSARHVLAIQSALVRLGLIGPDELSLSKKRLVLGLTPFTHWEDFPAHLRGELGRFIEALWANNDEAVALVLADWMEEQGAGSRAVWVRMMVGLFPFQKTVLEELTGNTINQIIGESLVWDCT